MSRRILVSVDPYEARAALLDGDRLINVEIEGTSVVKRKGNIYRGRVIAIQPSLEAAFVDYGAKKDGFLPLGEVSNKSLVRFSGHSRGQGKVSLRIGDPVLVQVTKEEFGKKGATLTTYVSLPGRFVVLMPFSERTGISRKLPGEERARLRQLASRLVVPDGFGFIVRTVGEEEDIQDLQADLDALVAEWREIERAFQQRKAPGEIHTEIHLAQRFIRDYMTSDVREILVEDEISHQEIRDYLQKHLPDCLGLLRRHQDSVPLFLKYGVENQIDALLQNRVSLPSGGSIVIAQTEALVAIDVNSGRTRQSDAEATALKTNLEAAREIARQLVLRDLGGIIVVDFIDMESEAHRRAVEQELRSSLRGDKARLTFTPIQEFGLLILTRQRLRQSVDSGITLPCPTCQGSGRVRSPNLQAMAVLRRIRERLATASDSVAYVEVTVPLEVAHFLNNRKREALLALERKYDVLLDVLGDPGARPDEFHLSALGDVPVSRRALYGDDGDEEAPSVEPESPALAPEPEAQSFRQASGEGRQRSFLKGLLTRVLGLGEEGPEPPPPPPPLQTQATGERRPEPKGPPSEKGGAVPASPPQPAPAENPEDAPRRKRRRRRRKSPAPEVASLSAGPHEAPSSREPEERGRMDPTRAAEPLPIPPAPDPTREEESPTSGNAAVAGETSRKRRRRRKRRPQGTGGGPEGGSPEALSPPGTIEEAPLGPEEPPPGPPIPGAAGPQPMAPRKTRSRPRRKSPAPQVAAEPLKPSGTLED